MARWKQFLQGKESRGELLVVTRDVWDLFIELHKMTGGNINNFEDDGSWPTLFDEFIEFI